MKLFGGAAKFVDFDTAKSSFKASNDGTGYNYTSALASGGNTLTFINDFNDPKAANLDYAIFVGNDGKHIPGNIFKHDELKCYSAVMQSDGHYKYIIQVYKNKNNEVLISAQESAVYMNTIRESPPAVVDAKLLFGNDTTISYNAEADQININHGGDSLILPRLTKYPKLICYRWSEGNDSYTYFIDENNNLYVSLMSYKNYFALGQYDVEYSKDDNIITFTNDGTQITATRFPDGDVPEGDATHDVWFDIKSDIGKVYTSEAVNSTQNSESDDTFTFTEQIPVGTYLASLRVYSSNSDVELHMQEFDDIINQGKSQLAYTSETIFIAEPTNNIKFLYNISNSTNDAKAQVYLRLIKIN